MEIKSLTERLSINIFRYFSHKKKEYDLKVIFRHAISAAREMQDVPAHFSLIWKSARRRTFWSGENGVNTLGRFLLSINDFFMWLHVERGIHGNILH